MVSTIIISILTVATIGICTGATFAVLNSVRADKEYAALEHAANKRAAQALAEYRAEQRRHIAGQALQVLLTAQRFANERKPAPYRLAK